MKFKLVLPFALAIILPTFLVNFLLADRFLHQLRKDEAFHRIAISKDWATFVEKKHENMDVPIYLGALKSQFREYTCAQTTDFSDSTKPDSELEAKLAVPWPDNYVHEFKQFFNPRTFNANAFAFYCYGHKKNQAWREAFINQLIDRLEKYSVEDSGALFFQYHFPFRPLDYDMPPLWRSAFAQGQILSGLILLNERAPSKRLKKIIEQYFLSFIPHQRKYEVSFTDSRGYLWLDEYPLPGNKPTSYVLNGHIWGIFGVYYYWDLTKNKEAEKILRMAIETVRDNISFFRFEGRVNCYDMRTCELDYEPRRAYIQLGWLSQITSHPSFTNAEFLIKRDHDMMVRYRVKLAECKKSFFNKLKCIWFPQDLLQLD